MKPRRHEPADELDQMIREREARSPGYADRVNDALARRRLARTLADQRSAKDLSQTDVAAQMGTSQSVVSKLESGADVHISTLLRYCAVIGVRDVHLAPEARRRRSGATRLRA